MGEAVCIYIYIYILNIVIQDILANEMATFLVLLFVTLAFRCWCNSIDANAMNTQPTDATEGSRNESTMGSRCHDIRNFSELNTHILSNKELLNNLTEAFFPAGEAPSTFVTITYRYSVTSNDNVSNSSETDYIDLYDYYIWSEKVLYLQFLCCPKALQLLTLFAIQVSEGSVTVQLPRLCRETRSKLLSRLTYQVPP